MALRVKAAKLEFYHPEDGTLRTTVTDKIRSVEIREEAGDRADDAGFMLAHDYADLNDFIVGDEVRVYIQTEDDASLTHIWTGIVDSYESDRRGSTFADLPFKAQDYVYWTLAHTYVTEVYNDLDVGTIVSNLLRDYAPSIGRANVETVGITQDAFVLRDESLLSAIRRLAELGEAEFRGDKDKNLHFHAKKTKSSGYSVDASKVVRGSFGVERSMDAFGNVVLVRGGSKLVEDESNAATPSSYSTVDETTRITQRVFVSKSKVARVDLYTKPDSPTALTGELLVRIQADNSGGTAPVDVGNPEADLSSQGIEADDLTDDGYTSFDLPDHIVPPGGHVWVIVEGSGGSQRVGVDGSSNLIYKTYYEVPIIVQREASGSIAQYGRRELQPVTDKAIRTEDDANALAEAIIAAHKDPRRVGSYEAQDMTLANVAVGTTVLAEFPSDSINAGTSLVVLSAKHRYDSEAGTYSLTHSFSDREKEQTVSDIMRSFANRIKRLEDTVWQSQIVSQLRGLTESVVISDTVTATEQTSGTFVVGTAAVDFSTVG